ncbi:MAG: anaerobic ribonucleoside-triphosphate reductase activating protein [Kiritimatiellae bacterium]|nr:anaerobic ribonucleoside-triphosphate reductase activating protein [Kiritimatiellia bacterium]
MKLAGFVPLSLCDYPGQVAAVVFTQGCNFRCPWCHNGHLLPLIGTVAGIISEDEVMDVVDRRRRLLGGVVVSGGEPTLQADLPRFMLRLKELGLSVKLDTNGTRPAVLKLLIAESLVDYIAMDVKAPWHQYSLLTGTDECDINAVQESLALVAASGVPHQFRTTRVDPLLDEVDYAEIKRQIPESSPHVWQDFRSAYSLDPSLRAEAAAVAR